jgi:hypothetical protein
MDPHRWSWAHILLVSLVWIFGALYFSLRPAADMVASGPSGGLIGWSSRALLRIPAVAFVPQLFSS